MKERLEVVEKSDMNDTYYSYYSALWIIATVYRMDHTIKYNMIDEDVLIVCTVHALMPLYVHISWMTSGWIGNQENQANTCLANMSSYVHVSYARNPACLFPCTYCYVHTYTYLYYYVIVLIKINMYYNLAAR